MHPAITLQVLDEFSDDGFRVAEEHPCLIEEVEFVINASKAGALAALDGEYGSGLIGIDDGHAEDWAALVKPGGRVHDVVCAEHKADIALAHVAVDFAHINEIGVGNLRFGE